MFWNKTDGILPRPGGRRKIAFLETEAAGE
jgi:hypothetical protein